MPTKRDYYEILGLAKGASEAEVKQAYKKLAKQYHPDVSVDPKAEEKFKEVQEAYAVLSDKKKRENYDQFGHAFEGFSSRQGFSGAGFDFEDLFSNFSGMGGGFGDVFQDFFGAQREEGRRHGSNVRIDVSIPFEEAAFGVEKEIIVERIGECETCRGTGSKDGKEASCSTCGGRGRVQQTQRTPFGMFSLQSTCPNCRGTGKIVEHPCAPCSGTGVQERHSRVNIKIPAGINTGNHIRLKGLGNAGSRGGATGDLFVVIFVEPHEVFKRDEYDVFCEIPLTFSEAALGAAVDVPTLYGKAGLNVKAGTQTGTLFRLKGKGIKHLNGSGMGDAYVKVVVETPKKMNKKEKALFEELRAEEKEARTRREGLFDRILKKFR